MPRPSKGARLVWRNEYRKADGSLRSSEGWYIEDRGKRRSTRCGRDELGEAERQLREYLATKNTPAHGRNRDADTVTFERIDAAYLSAALFVEMHGEAYMPIFERMAREREKALWLRTQLQEALERVPERQRKWRR